MSGESWQDVFDHQEEQIEILEKALQLCAREAMEATRGDLGAALPASIEETEERTKELGTVEFWIAKAKQELDTELHTV